GEATDLGRERPQPAPGLRPHRHGDGVGPPFAAHVDLRDLLPRRDPAGRADGARHRGDRRARGRGRGRAAERHLRQRGGADHRHRGPAGGALRPGEGVHHRLHHRQPAPGVRPGDAGGRAPLRDAALQPHGGLAGLHPAGAERGGARGPRRLPHAGGEHGHGGGAQPVAGDLHRPDPHLHRLAVVHAAHAPPPVHGRRALRRREGGGRGRPPRDGGRRGAHGRGGGARAQAARQVHRQAAHRHGGRGHHGRVPGGRRHRDGRVAGVERDLRGRDRGGDHRQRGRALHGDRHGRQEPHGRLHQHRGRLVHPGGALRGPGPGLPQLLHRQGRPHGPHLHPAGGHRGGGLGRHHGLLRQRRREPLDGGRPAPGRLHHPRHRLLLPPPRPL
ncbi:MAG: Ca(2+)/H(+) antiporter, partial [uncultured Gemmatimonadetes bacterium]